MKHLFTMLLALIAATASAQDFEKGGIDYRVLSEDDRTVEVTNVTDEYKGDIVIPEEVIYDSKVYSVTAIGDYAFNDCYDLTSVSMPSVTTIGDYAFYWCSALTSVSMPAVTTIGDLAFGACFALTSISMPSVTTIGDDAFGSCDALTSVSMPSVTTIGDRAFGYCSALTSVDMPSVTTIGDHAFGYCSALTSVDMPSVMTIGDEAFSFCSALTSVEMPSVTTIGDEAFNYCSALTSVDIPASVKMIGDDAFEGSSGLTAVYCHWDEPLECDPWFTDVVLENAILFVPRETVDAYRSVYPWSEFINIVEKDYSGIADTPGSEMTVKVIDGAIVIKGSDGTASAPVVEVYSAGGQCLYRGTDSSIGGLTHGVYVVKVGDTVQKVSL